jgi:hypothetical protein
MFEAVFAPGKAELLRIASGWGRFSGPASELNFMLTIQSRSGAGADDSSRARVDGQE